MLAFDFLDILARGGGGGSGGGGGGGGGGSGGGGGLALIFMIGYFPTNFIAGQLYRKHSAHAGYVGGILTAVAITMLSIWIIQWYGMLVGIGAVIGIYSGTHNLISRLGDKIKRSKLLMKHAATQDPVWHEPAVQTRVSEVFYAFQRDWSTFDLESIRTYTSVRYYPHVRLLLTALHQLGRQNVMENVKLQTAQIFEAIDHRNNDLDNFTVYVKASAADSLHHIGDKQVIYTDINDFEEFWRFDRQGNDWVLDGISQMTENASMLQQSLQAFAGQQGMYYSPDMGWLLLPQRGQLFGKSNFKKSDINNHVIGEWNGLLVQLYTYVPNVARKSADNYLIGQITLPKSYGGIVVELRLQGWASSLLNRRPQGYQNIEMEWPDFNKRYRVYATDMDKVTSFELLNPAFMSRLYDDDLKIDIEVVDNVVYFSTKVISHEKHYGQMLDVLQRAFRELRR